MAGPTILDESKVNLGNARAGTAMFATNNIRVALWEGGSSPDHTMTLTGFAAIETAFTGYARQQVTSWGSAALDGTFHDVFLGSTVTFTNSGGGPTNALVGFAYVDFANNKLLLIGKFPTPITIPAGQSYTFTPTWTGTGENLTT